MKIKRNKKFAFLKKSDSDLGFGWSADIFLENFEQAILTTFMHLKLRYQYFTNTSEGLTHKSEILIEINMDDEIIVKIKPSIQQNFVFITIAL